MSQAFAKWTYNLDQNASVLLDTEEQNVSTVSKYRFISLCCNNQLLFRKYDHLITYFSYNIYPSYKDYVVKENEWCDATNKDLYRKSLQDAQRNCFDDVTCTMFYDFKSEKNSFTACKYREYAGHNGINSAPIISESSLNSSLYIKCKLS